MALAATAVHGEFKVEFKKKYDDPYRIMAAGIVATESPRSVERILNSNSYIKSLVLKEAKMLDITGIFLDCIDQEIISNDSLRAKNAQLKRLGEFYFDNLDIPRLRKEIEIFISELI